MKAICSYCRSDLGEREPLDDPRVTHGMCDACAEHFHRQWGGLDLGEYLDTLSVPVLVMEGAGRILGANEHLARLLGKPRSEILGRLPGEVAECAYSRLDGGCGRTRHCAACTVRRAITVTYETGESQLRIRAEVQQDGRTLPLTISTFKVDDLVQLVIDLPEGAGAV